MCPQASCLILNTCHISINCILVVRKVAPKVQITFGLVCMDEHVY
jgi:hypothetical protein